MYDYIRGIITENYGTAVTVEANGVGYALSVSAFTAQKLCSASGEVKVYCRLNVREDEMSLYGFYDKTERAVFDKLVEISGVGAKLALTILGGLTPEAFSAAVVRGDVKTISSVKGVGKKIAERIALELKDKLSIDGNTIVAPEVEVSYTGLEDEAASALASLGFSKQEAYAAVKRVAKDGMSVEEILLAALKNS